MHAHLDVAGEVQREADVAGKPRSVVAGLASEKIRVLVDVGETVAVDLGVPCGWRCHSRAPRVTRGAGERLRLDAIY